MILLEVMLGTLLITMSGIALIALIAQTVQTVRSGRETERQTQSAAAALERATQLGDAELAMRVGRRRVGAWDIEVSVPAATLYAIDVHDTLTGATVLGTMVYRMRPELNGQ